MAILTRRKTAAAALVVVGIAGLSIASAAKLNLTEETTLGAGDTIVASCQPSDELINVSFGTVYGDNKAYDATSVVLSDISADCADKAYKVTVADEDGAALGIEEVGTVVVEEGVATIPLDPKVAAAKIEHVAVVIFDAPVAP